MSLEKKGVLNVLTVRSIYVPILDTVESNVIVEIILFNLIKEYTKVRSKLAWRIVLCSYCIRRSSNGKGVE
jgi:hypothetical protein